MNKRNIAQVRTFYYRLVSVWHFFIDLFDLVHEPNAFCFRVSINIDEIVTKRKK